MGMSRRELLRRLGGMGCLGVVPVLARCGVSDSDAAGAGADAVLQDVSPGGVQGDHGPATGEVKDVSDRPELPEYRYDGPLGPETLFDCGVASGDPLPNAVILWTALAPEPGEDAASVSVFVEVAEDQAFERRVSAGSYEAYAARGYTLKVDAVDLDPGRTYYYRFQALGRSSPVGRTKTAVTGDVEHLRFGVCSCSNYAYGYFYAYHHLAAREDLDAVIHLGDYIYEHGDGEYGGFRAMDPPYEIITLDDYRRRYRCYRLDPHLQEVHRQHAWIGVWDDHEFANNPVIGGAGNHDEGEGDWSARVAAAIQAYDEWLPTRTSDPGILYRSFDFGSLAKVVVLDIKRPRILPVEGEPETMLGAAQADWAEQQIANTQTPWLVLAQQQTFGTGLKSDGSGRSSWDRFPESRLRIRDAAAQAGIENVVVLTGDIHQARALDVTEDPHGAYDPATGEGAWAVEGVCGSISSPGSTSNLSLLPQHHWTEGYVRGYMVLDIRPEATQMDWFGFFDLAKVVDTLAEEAWFQGFRTEAGANHLVATTGPAEPKADVLPLAE